MTSSRDLEFDVARMFADDVTGHRLIVRLDQGLHRHLVFEQREHSWNNRFELITAPGSLTITGDRGAYTFCRLTDMFQFFRGRHPYSYGINPGYWAEKLPDAGRSAKVYSRDVLVDFLGEHLRTALAERDAIQREFDEEVRRQRDQWREGLRYDGVIDENDPDWTPSVPEKEEDWPELIKARRLLEDAQQEIRDYDGDGSLDHEDGARDLLRNLESIGLISGAWEWDLTDWDFHFLWCLHAIAWGIQQYDLAVRTGRHVVRSAPVAWDTPLPTVPPAKPEPAEKTAATPVSFEVAMSPARPYLVTVQPVGEIL